MSSLSDSLNCNLLCLQTPDINLGCKLHGTGTRALLLCMVPPQPLFGLEVKCNPMEVHQDLDYLKLISFLGYFPAHTLNFWEVMDLMNLLCSNWLSQ